MSARVERSLDVLEVRESETVPELFASATQISAFIQRHLESWLTDTQEANRERYALLSKFRSALNTERQNLNFCLLAKVTLAELRALPKTDPRYEDTLSCVKLFYSPEGKKAFKTWKSKNPDSAQLRERMFSPDGPIERCFQQIRQAQRIIHPKIIHPFWK